MPFDSRPIAVSALALVLVTLAGEARADLQVCNRTSSRVGVSIGYKDGEGWTTEGWWNIAAGQCEMILRGTLLARYYYLYAVDYDQGGEWAGKAFMCTRDKEFTIRGIEDCLARGYDRTGFFEVDTAEQKLWTVQLSDGGTPRSPAAAAVPGRAPPPAAMPLPKAAPNPAPPGPRAQPAKPPATQPTSEGSSDTAPAPAQPSSGDGGAPAAAPPGGPGGPAGGPAGGPGPGSGPGR